MENYVVSARKYRPQKFEEVVGQSHITDTLEKAIQNNQLAQSFLFCGPRGVGKTTCARILAKIINLQDGETETTEDFAFNIFELDAASNNSVDDIRTLIDQVRIPPQQGKYKVYIIDEVHMLSQSAFNAFLKTLEEPPSYAIFILATTEKHKIIPTILSRCQIFDFRRIPVEETVAHLEAIAQQEDIQTEKKALHIIAQKADGALRDALSMFDRLTSYGDKTLTYEQVLEQLNVLDYDYYFKVTDAILGSDVSATLNMVDDILDRGFEGDDFLLGQAEHFRNLLVAKDPATAKLLEVAEDLQERYFNQANLCSASLLVNALNIASQTDVSYKMSKNKRLLVELALIKMCHIKDAVTMVNTPQEFKKKTNLETKPSKDEGKHNDTSQMLRQAQHDTTSLEDKKTKTDNSQPSTDSVSISPEASGEQDEDKSQSVEDQQPTTRQPEPVEGQHPVEDVLKKSTKLSSLDAIEKEIEAKEHEERQKQNSLKADGSIDPTMFFEMWKKYIQIAFDEKRSVLHSLMITLKPELKDNFVHIITNNDFNKGLMQKEVPGLVDFFRKEQGISNIEFTFAVDERVENQEKKAYTSKDRYDILVEKNPSIKNLKDQLGLELEF